jgi:hypothetical protein
MADTCPHAAAAGLLDLPDSVLQLHLLPQLAGQDAKAFR